MSMADEEVRLAFTQLLRELVERNHQDTTVAYIGGSYAENYSRAIQLIDGIYQEY